MIDKKFLESRQDVVPWAVSTALTALILLLEGFDIIHLPHLDVEGGGKIIVAYIKFSLIVGLSLHVFLNFLLGIALYGVDTEDNSARNFWRKITPFKIGWFFDDEEDECVPVVLHWAYGVVFFYGITSMSMSLIMFFLIHTGAKYLLIVIPTVWALLYLIKLHLDKRKQEWI